MQNDVIAPDLGRCSVQWASRGEASPLSSDDQGLGQDSTKPAGCGQAWDALTSWRAVVRAGGGHGEGWFGVGRVGNHTQPVRLRSRVPEPGREAVSISGHGRRRASQSLARAQPSALGCPETCLLLHCRVQRELTLVVNDHPIHACISAALEACLGLCVVVFLLLDATRKSFCRQG